jgi:hypothetical protein
MSKLTRISNKVVVYNERRQAYVSSMTHNKTKEAILGVKEWRPAYRMEARRGKLKGRTVIEPVRRKLNASGVITVIFSKEPFQ